MALFNSRIASLWCGALGEAGFAAFIGIAGKESFTCSLICPREFANWPIEDCNCDDINAKALARVAKPAGEI